MSLEKILKEKDVPCAWLARRLNLNRSTITLWVKGKSSPHKKHYPAIAKALGLSEKEVASMFAKE